MITISKINFPIYVTIIFVSIFLGMLYVALSLKKEIKLGNNIYLYFLLNILLILFLGKTFTMITSKSLNFLTIGFSSYGGAIATMLCSFFFEKLWDLKGYLIKYSAISLPLIYGLSKIACFIAGCCYGIPYDGPFSVTYPDNLNIPLFPAQLLEAITFILIFIICNKFKNKKNIVLITICSCAISKFLLDFLRYEHINRIITFNQIFSIIIILISIIILIKRKIDSRKIK